jgi:hypothetical protein
MVNKMTPMHEPAIMPGEVILHVEAMKQESTVYQFHSICSKVSSQPLVCAVRAQFKLARETHRDLAA